MNHIVKTRDEFAPHWSAILNDGTLSVTFELATTLTEIPEAGLVDVLRAAIIAQRGETISLRMIVAGHECRTECSTAADVGTVITDVLVKTGYIAKTGYAMRDLADWELRDDGGHMIDHGLTIGAAVANYPNHDPLWLSPRAGYGA